MTKEELQAILNGNKPQQEEKPKRKCRQHEGSLQIACVRWFRLQYPQYAMLLFHPRNEAGQGKSKRIAIDAAAGVVAGVPDLMLALPLQQTKRLETHFQERLFSRLEIRLQQTTSCQRASTSSTGQTFHCIQL